MRLKNFTLWFLKSDEPKAQRARRFSKLAIILLMFIALFWIIPLRSVIQALLHTDPILFIVGVVLGLVTIFLSSVQMKPLLDNQGINRSIMQINKINLAVKFYLLLMPTTLVASGYRWYRFAQPEGKVAESFVALAFIRLFKTFVTIALGLGFLLISTQQTLIFQIGWIFILVLGIIIIWVMITQYSLPIYNWFRKKVGFKFDRPVIQRILRIVEKLLTSASSYADMPVPALLFSMSAGILSALVGIASGVYFAWAVGIELSFLELGWALSIVTLTTQFTLSIMEGLGVREVTLVAILSLFNIRAEQALALSFLIFSRGVIIASIGGLIEAFDTLRARRSAKPDTISSESTEI